MSQQDRQVTYKVAIEGAPEAVRAFAHIRAALDGITFTIQIPMPAGSTWTVPGQGETVGEDTTAAGLSEMLANAGVLRGPVQ